MKTAISIECVREVSEIELVYKSKVKPSKRPTVMSSLDAYHIFIKYWDENKIELIEQFNVMFLNRAAKVLAIYQMSTGGITGTVADIRLIFTAALKLGAVNILVAHNHPSGNIFPSNTDKELTEKIKQAGRLLNIRLFDHLIIAPEAGYYSMTDHGLV